MQRSKYIQSSTPDAGWLLVAQPGPLGTCFMQIESASLTRVPISRSALGFFHVFLLFARAGFVLVAWWAAFLRFMYVRSVWPDPGTDVHVFR